ncbi:Ig-like domain-containing protein, partial [Mycolicibacterium sphagni]
MSTADVSQRAHVIKTVVGIAESQLRGPSQPDTSSTRASDSTVGATESRSTIVPSAPATSVPSTALVGNTFSGLLRAIALTSLGGYSPLAPVEPPTDWAFLAWTRRQYSGFRFDPVKAELAASGRSTPDVVAATRVNTLAGPAFSTRASAVQGQLNSLVSVLRYTFLNTTPTADPVQNPGQSETGVVTGNLNGGPNGASLTYTVTQNPVAGVAAVNADGTFTYSPDADLAHNGGTDKFTVTVDSGSAYRLNGALGAIQEVLHSIAKALGLSGPDTTVVVVSVSIVPVNQPPVATGYTASSPDPLTGTVTGTATATDPNNDTLTYTGPTTSTGGGTVTVSPTGAFTYTPTTDAQHNAATIGAGSALTQDSFTVTITDAHGGQTTQTITVAINPTNTAPVAGTALVGTANPTTGTVIGSAVAT